MTTLSDTPGEGLDPKALETICRTLAGLVRDHDIERVAGAIVDDLRDEGFAISVVASDTAALPSDYEGVKELCTKFFYWWHNQPGTNTQAGFDDWWKVEGEAIAALGRVQPVATANCCKCGRIVDTRERSEGGDPFGAELNDGQWVCSIECWEAVVDTDATPPAPQPALALIEELTGALEGVVRVANRATLEFDAAHVALASAKRFKGE